MCCDSWGRKESDTTEQLNNNKIFIGRTDAEAEAPILWAPDVSSQLTEKDPHAGKG